MTTTTSTRREPGSVTVNGKTYAYPANLTYNDKRIIRELTGLAGVDWVRAWARFDDDVALGLAAVAMHRSGDDYRLLDRLDIGQIDLVFPSEGDDSPPDGAAAEQPSAS